MCNRALNWAFEQDLPPIDKFVLVAIANMLNGKTNACWPTQSTIAKLCGICRQRVNEALAMLRSKGLVLVEARMRADGGDAACKYGLPVSSLTTPSVAHDDIPLHPVSSMTAPPVVNDDTKEPLKEPNKKDPEAYASGADAPPDPVKELWDRGVKALGGTPASRGLLAKMRNEHGDLPVMDAILACERTAPTDPIAYFRGCLRGKVKGNAKRSPAEKLYAGFAQAAGGFSFGGAFDDPLLDPR